MVFTYPLVRPQEFMLPYEFSDDVRLPKQGRDYPINPGNYFPTISIHERYRHKRTDILIAIPRYARIGVHVKCGNKWFVKNIHRYSSSITLQDIMTVV